MNLPLVSVIITAYNKAQTIERTIKSLCKQSYENIEIIVIDDASCDDTSMICQKYSEHIIYIRNERNIGLYNSRLQGIKCANGTYITYIDADDWISHCSISLCVETALKQEADIVQMKIKRVSPRLKIVWGIDCQYDINNITAGWLYNEKLFPISCCTKLYKRDLLRSVDFPEFNQFWGEDRVFNLAVLTKTPKVSMADKAIYYYRWGGESVNTFDKTILQQYKNVYTHKYNWATAHDYCEYIPYLKQELIDLLNYYIRHLIDSNTLTDDEMLANLKVELEDRFWEDIKLEAYTTLFLKNKKSYLRQIKRIARKFL